MRQGPGQEEFKKILENIAMGTFTRKDWDILKKRELKANFDQKEIEAIKAKSVKICSRIKATKKCNEDHIKALGVPILRLRSLNSGGKEAKYASTNEAGLLQSMTVAKGCQVLLIRNLKPDAGLTNGARGEVRCIVYPEGWNDKDLPMVICHFPSYRIRVYKTPLLIKTPAC